MNHLCDVVDKLKELLPNVFSYNELTARIEVRPSPAMPVLPWRLPGDLTPIWRNRDLGLLRACLGDQHNLHIRPELLREAVEVIAHLHPYEPVQRYLDGCYHITNRAAAPPILDDWLRRTFDTPASDYSRAIARKSLIQAVARAIRPGEQADTVLVLEGPQGSGKSSALSILGGPWYRAGIKPLHDPRCADGLLGAWLVELPELRVILRADPDRAKDFITTRFDPIRLPYDRLVEDLPRRCVLIGTTNRSEYLSDLTGDRRYWPASCPAPQADLDWLRHHRDQLWGEATAAYRVGEQWWLTPAEEALARDEQEARRQLDPLEGQIAIYLRYHDQVTTAEVRQDVSFVQADARSARSIETRIGMILKRFGWEKKRARQPGVDEPVRSYARVANSYPPRAAGTWEPSLLRRPLSEPVPAAAPARPAKPKLH